MRAETDWWRDQLAIARETNELALRFVLLLLYSLAPLRTIKALSSEISSALDIMNVAEWGELLEAAKSALRSPRMTQEIVAKKNEHKLHLYGAELDLGSEVSPRLICFLLFRLPSTVGRLFYLRYLSSYRGDDEFILGTCVDMAENLAMKGRYAWAEALPVIAHAYSRGVVRDGVPRFRTPKPYREIPAIEARQICANAVDYPLSLVGAAELTLTAQTGAQAIPVGKIAARDDWFPEQ
jgi:hypothetical protein